MNLMGIAMMYNANYGAGGRFRMFRKRERGVHEFLNRPVTPLANLLWAAAAVLFLLLLVLQVTVVVSEQAVQSAAYRERLTRFCNVVGCELPLSWTGDSVTLTAVRIVPHPHEPAALRVRFRVVNEGDYAQSFPRVQLTLTDRNGLVVGRRVYLPKDYLGEGQRNRLGAGAVGAAQLKLAQPHKKAVGFRLEILRGTTG